jgi:hypothetical protein
MVKMSSVAMEAAEATGKASQWLAEVQQQQQLLHCCSPVCCLLLVPVQGSGSQWWTVSHSSSSSSNALGGQHCIMVDVVEHVQCNCPIGQSVTDYSSCCRGCTGYCSLYHIDPDSYPDVLHPM